MRVFITGASGFIGTALIPELQSHGHQVLGLVRNDAGAEKVAALGAEVLRGTVGELEVLREGARGADAVIHLAFPHDDFTKMAEYAEGDRLAIGALAEGLLAGSRGPLVVTSGVALAQPSGPVGTEDDPPLPVEVFARAKTELAAEAAAAQGLPVAVMRLSQIHDTRKQGLIPYLIANARQKGKLAYVGEGQTGWAAAHISDTVQLYRLVLERAAANGPGYSRYHAVAEESVSNRAIAETLAQPLRLPVESITPEQAGEYFGWLAMFAGREMGSSSQRTREELGWKPTGPSLLTDLANLHPEA